MGNLVDLPPIETEEPSSAESADSESELGAVDMIIDLDAPEYHEYLKAKRKSLSEGAMLNDISYLEWKKNNNVLEKQQRKTETKHRNGHRRVLRRRSTPITGDELLVVQKNSEEYEKRAKDSKQRIDDVKKKYNLKNRDYNARTYVWNEQDEQQAKVERQQRKLLRQQIRLKYKLPTPKTSRTTVIASG